MGGNIRYSTSEFELPGALRDIAACDVRVCLFRAALYSSKSATICKPPVMREEMWDKRRTDSDYFIAMRKLLADIPPLVKLKEQDISLEKQCNQLLACILTTKIYTLHTVPAKVTFRNINRHIGASAYRGKAPNLVFEVIYRDAITATRASDSSGSLRQRRDAFDTLKARHGYHLAYHGTAFENLFSILNTGFLGHLNTTSLYGKGTYLSSDLSVANGFATSTKVWESSYLASRMTCVCVCEVIDHEDVKRGVRQQPGISLESTDTIPDKYFVVPSNDHIRVRYLLVWSEPKAATSQTFYRRHKVWVALGVYVLCLIAAGLYRSDTARRVVMRYLKGI